MESCSPEWTSSSRSPRQGPDSERIEANSVSEPVSTTAIDTSPVVDKSAIHTCDIDGCSSRPFKRRVDLNRHKKTHESVREYECSALGCNRVGAKGFQREDKLIDHMLAGHDDETIFTCPRCSLNLSMDLITIHRPWSPSKCDKIARYRTCSMPRCSFKVYFRKSEAMDGLISHLLEKHDLKQRNHFANLLRQRGYDAQTGGIPCPICPAIGCFLTHKDFYEHFMQVHFHGPVCGFHYHSESCPPNCYSRGFRARLSRCTMMPDEVKPHRRTILRVWPDFSQYRVWDDIERCTPSADNSRG